MKKPTKLSDLKPAIYNPRTISEAAASGLRRSMDEFGDISGIVFNKRTGQLVAGHQRVSQLKATHGDLAVKDGAVVAPDGRQWPVRVVDWPRAKEVAANIAVPQDGR